MSHLAAFSASTLSLSQVGAVDLGRPRGWPPHHTAALLTGFLLSMALQEAPARQQAAQSAQVDVDLGDRSYPIYIGAGLLDQAELLQQHVRGRRTLVVTNETIAPLYLQRRAPGAVHAAAHIRRHQRAAVRQAHRTPSGSSGGSLPSCGPRATRLCS